MSKKRTVPTAVNFAKGERAEVEFSSGLRVPKDSEWYFLCATCGRAGVDEDTCCSSCGRDCAIVMEPPEFPLRLDKAPRRNPLSPGTGRPFSDSRDGTNKDDE